MNTKKLIGTSMIALLVVAMGAGMAAAITVDGRLSDWGLTVDTATADWSQDGTWIPDDIAIQNVQYVVEDNMHPDYAGEPATYATGVHIYGTSGGASMSLSEPKVVYDGTLLAEPVGGEHCDIEAIYKWDDMDNVYIAIVTSLTSGYKYTGDIGFDITGVNANIVGGGITRFEYGVVLNGLDAPVDTSIQVPVQLVDTWTRCTHVSENSPARIESGTPTGETATVTYAARGDLGYEDLGFVHNTPICIVEVKIPKTAFGGAPDVNLFTDVHHSEVCGNDHNQNDIPEFAVLAVPVAALMGLVFFMRRKK